MYYYESTQNVLFYRGVINMHIWLKQQREQLGYTQESFAKEVGVAKTTYSSYEQGHRTPSIATAKKMAEILQVPWTIFFDNKVLESYAGSKGTTTK